MDITIEVWDLEILILSAVLSSNRLISIISAKIEREQKDVKEFRHTEMIVPYHWW